MVHHGRCVCLWLRPPASSAAASLAVTASAAAKAKVIHHGRGRCRWHRPLSSAAAAASHVTAAAAVSWTASSFVPPKRRPILAERAPSRRSLETKIATEHLSRPFYKNQTGRPIPRPIRGTQRFRPDNLQVPSSIRRLRNKPKTPDRTEAEQAVCIIGTPSCYTIMLPWRKLAFQDMAWYRKTNGAL